VTEWVAGRTPVLESLRAGRRAGRKLFLLQGAKGLDAIRSLASGIPVVERSRRELDALAHGAVHQGVLLEADPLPVARLEDWIGNAFPDDAVAVALDEIEDPHNFGAIVRSAAACGACGVIFGKRRAAPLSPASLKSAAGAMEYIDLVRVSNLVRGLGLLKEAGFWIAALDAAAPTVLWDADLRGRIALVVGSEGRGLRRLVRTASDLLLSIPVSGPITSLNASVSAAIALAECARQRRHG